MKYARFANKNQCKNRVFFLEYLFELQYLLKNGEIAVAPDKVVAETVGLSADAYTAYAKQMCLKMEENVRQGVGKKISVHWFKKGGGR